MVYLTSTDRQELHTAILEYLKSSSSSSAPIVSQVEELLQQQMNTSTATASSSSSSSSTLIEKRWSTFKRLTLANTQLEEKCKKLEAEVTRLKDPMSSKKQINVIDTAHSNNSNSNSNSSNTGPLPLLPKGPSPLHQFKGHRDTVNCIAIHPLEPLIFSGSSDGTVRVWSTQTKKQIQKFETSGDRITSLAIEPVLGEMLAVGVSGASDGVGVLVYEQDNGDIGDDNNTMDLNSNIGGDSGSRTQYVCTKSLRQSSADGGEDVTCVAWCTSEESSPSSATLLHVLISCSENGTICIWSVNSNNSNTGDHQRRGRRHKLKWELNLAELEDQTGSNSINKKKILSIATTLVSHNPFLGIGCGDQFIYLFDLSSSSSSSSLTYSAKSNQIHDNAITGLSFLTDPNVDSQLVEKYCSPEKRATRREWMKNPHNNNNNNNNYHEGNPQFLVSCSRDKNLVLSEIRYSSSSSSSIMIIPLSKFEGHGGWITSLVVLPSSNNLSGVFVATCSDDDTIRVVDLLMKNNANIKEVRRVTDDSKGSSGVLAVAPPVSSCKLLMCSGGVDRLVSVWGFEE